MLERATACLKFGAARESLRCVAKAPRSRRMLHSSFWSHGAGDLDLPSWAVSMLPMPTDVPLRHDDKRSRHNGGLGGRGQQGQLAGHGMTDGIFLDFLYPQQALALLHKHSSQQGQRWERRNARRLPDGFVVASRGYASRTRTAKAKRAAEQQRQKKEDEDGDNELVFQQEPEVHAKGTDQKKFREPEERWDNRRVEQAAREEQEDYHVDFADSPMNLAEPSPEAIRKLRNIMSFSRKRAGDLRRQREDVAQAWTLYQRIDDDGQADARLKTEMLSWLNAQQTEQTDAYCAELYHSMPAPQRTQAVYEVALSMFIRRNQHLSMSKLHREALKNLENGYQISRMLFRYAIDNEMWRLAIRTEGRHKEFYGESSQMQLFWIHASAIPQLLSKALKLVKFLGPIAKTGRIDTQTQQFCTTFFKEAITQEFLQADASLHFVPSISKQNPPRDRIRRLFLTLVDWNTNDSRLFEATLMSLIDPSSRFPYSRMHHLVSYVFDLYKTIRGVLPSEHLLMSLLRRVTQYADRIRRDNQTRHSLSVSSLVRDWRRFHRRLSKEAHERVTSYYARAGRNHAHEAAMTQFQEDFPHLQDRRSSLWTSIYVYARRADLDGAQQAFAAVKRELAEQGEEPDLKCWNTLLHAHSRVDDLEGALTNLQNLMDYAKLTPDAHSFHPLAEMLAKRGDVDGVEDMLEQYDELTQAPRTTPLLGSLITAFVRSDDIENAENVLRDTSDKAKKGEVTGSLTKCFNLLLTAHAVSRDIEATKRVYRWMREQKTRLNAESYGALIFALTVRRQTDAAYKIVTSAMKESGVEPTAFHYSLVMAAFVNAGRVDDALRVHKDMMQLNIKTTLSSKATYLRARAIQEHRESNRHSESLSNDPSPLERTLQDLQQLMRDSEESGVAAKTPQTDLKSASLADADLAAHFDFLIFVHGQRRCFEAVKQLYQQSQELAAERGVEQDAPPIRLVTALMSAYWRAGDYNEVEASWKMAKERADATAPTMPVPLLSKANEESAVQQGQSVLNALELESAQQEPDEESSEPSADSEDSSTTTSQPRQPLLNATSKPRGPLPAPGRRHILTRPLRYYLASLTAQNRLRDLVSTVAGLLAQGYRLDNRTFNYFIECLCRASPPLALLAFTLTEKFLIPRFPGWVHDSKLRRYGERPQAQAEGLQNIRARYLKPGTLMPQYRTLVRLGSVLLDVRRLEAMGRRSSRRRAGQRRGAEGKEDILEKYVGTMAEIRRRAPRTLFAVQSMPHRPDRLQSQLLRREG